VLRRSWAGLLCSVNILHSFSKRVQNPGYIMADQQVAAVIQSGKTDLSATGSLRRR
jgi:hypothetical protein